MRVIPVIDLMRGQVVRGVGGRRDEYRPIESKLAPDARPASVARALRAHGFREVYVADLDAIGGAPPARPVYEDILACGLAALVDAGLSTVEQARQLADFEAEGRRLSGIVGGLESLRDPDTLAEMVAVVGSDRFVFSLDLKLGAPLTSAPPWRELSPLQIAAIALRAGVRRMIVLDLAAVGMNQGVGTLPLCRALRCFEKRGHATFRTRKSRMSPFLEIIAGGGVRGSDDLCALAAAGVDGALVASALHDGRLSAVECAAWR